MKEEALTKEQRADLVNYYFGKIKGTGF